MKKFLNFALVCALMVVSTFALFGCGGAKAKVKVIDIKLTDEEYAFIVSKNNTELLAKVNEIMAEIKADGTFNAIVNKYFAEDAVIEGVTSATKDSSKNQLVIATNAEFPPFEYKEGNKFCGIDMEIAKVLADKMGKELVIDDIKFDAVVTSVKDYADIGMAGLTVTEDRKLSVNFTDTYFNASQRIIVLNGDTTFDGCTTVAEVEAILNGMTGKTVGFQSGTTGESYLIGSESFGFPGYSNITPKGYDNAALAVLDMINGNINFVIVDDLPASSIVNKYNKRG